MNKLTIRASAATKPYITIGRRNERSLRVTATIEAGEGDRRDQAGCGDRGGAIIGDPEEIVRIGAARWRSLAEPNRAAYRRCGLSRSAAALATIHWPTMKPLRMSSHEQFAMHELAGLRRTGAEQNGFDAKQRWHPEGAGSNDEIAAGGFVELDGRTKIDVAVRHAGGVLQERLGSGIPTDLRHADTRHKRRSAPRWRRIAGQPPVSLGSRFVGGSLWLTNGSRPSPSPSNGRRSVCRCPTARIWGPRPASRCDNTSAFDELGFRPVTAGQPAERQMDTTIRPTVVDAGHDLAHRRPAIHPDGEVGVARAAANRGIRWRRRSRRCRSIRHRGQRPDLLPDLLGRRQGLDGRRMERAKAAGAVGMILTDWSFSHGRDWAAPDGSRSRSRNPSAGPGGDPQTEFMWSWIKSGSIPKLGVPNCN